jgi:hypothetical protein
MSAYTNLQAVSLTAAEQSSVAALNMDGADAKGILNSVLLELEDALIKLTYIHANMGVTTNATTIASYITTALT